MRHRPYACVATYTTASFARSNTPLPCRAAVTRHATHAHTTRCTHAAYPLHTAFCLCYPLLPFPIPPTLPLLYACACHLQLTWRTVLLPLSRFWCTMVAPAVPRAITPTNTCLALFDGVAPFWQRYAHPGFTGCASYPLPDSLPAFHLRAGFATATYSQCLFLGWQRADPSARQFCALRDTGTLPLHHTCGSCAATAPPPAALPSHHHLSPMSSTCWQAFGYTTYLCSAFLNTGSTTT